MKATIIAHESPPADASVEIHRFKFLLDDGTASPLAETISLRTARVIVENLEDGNAFIKMLQAIVMAQPAEYDDLVGRIFPDHYKHSSDGGHPTRGCDGTSPIS
ncbi:hypothetical protein AWB76_02374 [Caballeronia temeraria]|uniref:Uncharacterized protein n=1 Tax=Caballeronia temeraria TaxID=1777137 RepID=A0A158AGY3_9BURK|nr:hypothetical protein [Caballeronia temeraria]SAK56916.1 hypothetical protein AWB76_02374 [Caballeronia temeraria]